MASYQECLNWLFGQLPMYQRLGASAYKADLSNTLQLMNLLGNPERKFKSIHIAGTNGKGSTSHMLAAIFQAAGYKTGLYTSPHLIDFRERIKINGETISEDAVVAFVEKHKADFTTIGLSFFEMTVGMAFDFFATQEVDIAIIEVGMGGRLDSTNVIVPELSVITNISLDHTAFLGDTYQAIAREKAGIIKKNVPVVIGEHQPETDEVFIAIASERSSPLFFAEDQIADDVLPNSDLKGFYQKNNIRTVLAAVQQLEDQGYKLKDNLEFALQHVRSTTGLHGRWEEIQQNPRLICDTGHNEAGVKFIIEQLNTESFDKLHMVWGMVGDKDAKKILAMLPKDASYYWCQPDIPRAKKVEELAAEAQTFNLQGKIFSTVEEAVNEALTTSNTKDLIFVGGSTFVVADMLRDLFPTV